MNPAAAKPVTVNRRPSMPDLVQVYCRLRQMQLENEVSCLRVLPPNTVLASPPDSAHSYRKDGVKTMKYTFKEVFPPESTQQEIFDKVAMPLLESLVKGEDGLMFTYGVTNSGKTFTMTGEPQNSGILPRCLSVLFKSICDYQAPKYVFKPDKMNKFDVLTEAKAKLERQQELPKLRAGKKEISSTALGVSSLELTKVEGVNEANRYAVFVTYIEIYNNSIYDLLDECSTNAKNIDVKTIREDAAHNMYVHGVTEVEIRSAEEAFNVFYRGLKRKHMAHTTLNSDSSRSHSVFTIRLVQAPFDEMRGAVIADKKLVCISQLSLADLAGSERTSRTNNTGKRVRETASINCSLMALRTCMEAKRFNKRHAAKKRVPYRNAKLTLLFKKFFEEAGQVRMVVCVNPRSEDCDETMQVLKFAEVVAVEEVAHQAIVEERARLDEVEPVPSTSRNVEPVPSSSRNLASSQDSMHDNSASFHHVVLQAQVHEPAISSTLVSLLSPEDSIEQLQPGMFRSVNHEQTFVSSDLVSPLPEAELLDLVILDTDSSDDDYPVTIQGVIDELDQRIDTRRRYKPCKTKDERLRDALKSGVQEARDLRAQLAKKEIQIVETENYALILEQEVEDLEQKVHELEDELASERATRRQ